MASTPPPYDTYAGYHAPSVPMPPPTPVAAPSSYVPVQNAKDNPPCNTLFIGNLPENINEEELWSLLSSSQESSAQLYFLSYRQPGFNQMKILRQERHTVCFIEFEDVNSATNVHHNLQGAVIPSSATEPDAGAPKSMKSTYNIFSNVPISLLTDILRKSTLL
uniref:RRM domain-containing protein n=1 Tax=Brassica oleracea var. oleracea TaxID=109376 RepID=A0A0D3CHP2_BRAOL